MTSLQTFSTTELARLAGVSPATVRRLCAVGEIQASRLTSSSPRRISRASAAAILARIGRELPEQVEQVAL